jgi:hypothetical protein
MEERNHDAEGTRDEAIDRVERHANTRWKVNARTMIWWLAYTRAEFTADAVWELLARTSLKTHEPRAMGPMMQDACRRGLIEPTDAYTRSHRRSCHNRPIRVWRSRVVGA